MAQLHVPILVDWDDIKDHMAKSDIVEVVRCRDCKWWREETDHTCRKWGGASPRKANGYCDDGERSEDGGKEH